MTGKKLSPLEARRVHKIGEILDTLVTVEELDPVWAVKQLRWLLRLVKA